MAVGHDWVTRLASFPDRALKLGLRLKAD